jgi:hypothetical protein
VRHNRVDRKDSKVKDITQSMSDMKSSPDDHYWLKMFRRALLQDDQCAREQFQQHFSKVVLDWLHLHPKREEAYRYEREEYYLVQRAFHNCESSHR